MRISDWSSDVCSSYLAYRIYIRALLSLTDNIVDGAVVHPDHVVCGDNDDPYFVVAADKGTASFSDIANGIALERGFWLGDAFASGGSNGYDHKARSEEHTSELQSLMRISYAVFCLKKKN